MHLYLLMEEGSGHIENVNGEPYNEIIKARTIISLLYFVKLF